jgi:hypothetical protein
LPSREFPPLIPGFPIVKGVKDARAFLLQQMLSKYGYLVGYEIHPVLRQRLRRCRTQFFASSEADVDLESLSAAFSAFTRSPVKPSLTGYSFTLRLSLSTSRFGNS